MTGITGINEILMTLISLLPLIVPVLVIGGLVHLAEGLVHHRKGTAEGRPMPPVPHWHTRPLRFSVWLRVFVTLAAMWAGVEVYAPMGDYVALGLWLVLIPALTVCASWMVTELRRYRTVHQLPLRPHPEQAPA